jgi:hypothetical protein
MDENQPIMRDQRNIDNGHLRLLSMFHYIVSGFSILGIGFLAVHHYIMQSVFSNPAVFANQQKTPFPSDQFMSIFVYVYIAIGILLLLAAVVNLLSGIFIHKRINRTFSIIVAAVNCIQIPVGTILGVFTISILNRDTVAEQYHGLKLRRSILDQKLIDTM